MSPSSPPPSTAPPSAATTSAAGVSKVAKRAKRRGRPTPPPPLITRYSFSPPLIPRQTRLLPHHRQFPPDPNRVVQRARHARRQHNQVRRAGQRLTRRRVALLADIGQEVVTVVLHQAQDRRGCRLSQPAERDLDDLLAGVV